MNKIKYLFEASLVRRSILYSSLCALIMTATPAISSDKAPIMNN